MLNSIAALQHYDRLVYEGKPIAKMKDEQKYEKIMISLSLMCWADANRDLTDPSMIPK